MLTTPLAALKRRGYNGKQARAKDGNRALNHRDFQSIAFSISSAQSAWHRKRNGARKRTFKARRAQERSRTHQMQVVMNCGSFGRWEPIFYAANLEPETVIQRFAQEDPNYLKSVLESQKGDRLANATKSLMERKASSTNSLAESSSSDRHASIDSSTGLKPTSSIMRSLREKIRRAPPKSTAQVTPAADIRE